MFRWYQNAEICYAYLADVPSPADQPEEAIHDIIKGSRWFTRGWTLQELIAPKHLEFYSQDWKSLGSKLSLCDLMTSITGIEKDFLCGLPLEEASIAKRMSWAALRQTSRIEDTAYCLLGTFNINMPLLYGEGTKAFRRLQTEIMKSYPFDQSLFAWGDIVINPPVVTDPDHTLDFDTVTWSAKEASRTTRGLFAESPREFRYSAAFGPSQNAAAFYDPYFDPVFPYVVGDGVRLELPVPQIGSDRAPYHWPGLKIVQMRRIRFAVLLCDHGDGVWPTVAIPLINWGIDFYSRTGDVYLLPYEIPVMVGRPQRQLLHIEAEPPARLRRGDVMTRISRHAWAMIQNPVFRLIKGKASTHGYGVVIIPRGTTDTLFHIIFNLGGALSRNHKPLGFALHFDRELPEDDEDKKDNIGSTVVSLTFHILRQDRCTERAPCFPVEELGHTWVCDHRPWPAMRVNRTVMKRPEDTVVFNMPPLPPVTIQVKRTHPGDDVDNTFDLIDISIRDNDPGRLKKVVAQMRRDEIHARASIIDWQSSSSSVASSPSVSSAGASVAENPEGEIITEVEAENMEENTTAAVESSWYVEQL